MKRLKLEDFKVKNLKKDKSKQVEQLLGQILGNCQDGLPNSGGQGGGQVVEIVIDP